MLFDYQLAKKDYIQINIFLASGGGVEKNLKALLMKTSESLGSGARREILNFINGSLGGSHKVVARDWIA